MDTRSLDRLGDEIAELSAHLDAATARLLELIREFDAREGWNTGFRSCAAWLSWRVGLDLGAARERVRVARALGTLPRLAQALARGELSYAKVRALTRVATPETEERLVAVGRAGTAEHVESSPRARARANRGSVPRARATRTRSRAAPRSSPTRQLSQAAQERKPVFQPPRASNSRMRSRRRAVAASRCADSSAISSPRRSSESVSMASLPSSTWATLYPSFGA